MRMPVRAVRSARFTEPLRATILALRHSGFSVHNAVRVRAGDARDRLRKPAISHLKSLFGVAVLPCPVSCVRLPGSY